MAAASLGAVAMGLVGLVSLLRARRGRRGSDPDAAKRLADSMEMERRMASYLAQSGSEPVPRKMNNQGASDERG
ncbi:MAG: hypothetical protein V4712_16430 [Pseudomonadota bacterium]